jgi:hypothetical protein
MNDPHAQPRSGQAEHMAEHEHVAELLRAVDVRAPETLHRRIQGMVAPPRKRGARRSALGRGLMTGRLKPTLAAMAVAAIAGATIALLTGGAAQQRVSLSAASALTLRAATSAAPSESGAHAAQLDVAVDGVPFPYWEERFGWRATGARTDTVGGRIVTTVFYSGAGDSRIGYAIVAGTPAPATSGGTVSLRGGVPYRLLQEHGVPVVTWQRDGRLCVLSGRGVSGATLLRLAGWGDGRPVPS